MSIVEAPLAVAAPARRPNPRPTPLPTPEVRPRHLRVVGPPARARRRLTPATGVLLTVLLFATLFLVAIAHTVLVQGQVRLDALDAQLTTEQARYQELRTDVAEMESPARVVAAAEALGMVAPQDLVYLQPDAADRPEPSTTPPDDDATAEVAAGSNSTWSDVKPLLEAAAP